ncbi:polysaccharide deacetylase family protein [bacterium]|nr:polysaccharide deacetylase family protein [bacterium]
MNDPESNKVKRFVPILVFHKVDPRFEWGVTRITPQKFESILHYLRDMEYTGISLAQAMDNEFDLPSKPIVITFDDSYASIFEHAAPLLRTYGFTATIFVITGYAGNKNLWDVNLGGLTFRHLSWEEVKALSKLGFEIGSHTVHHPDLTRIPCSLLERELIESKEQLENEIGKSVQMISFPFGRYNDSVIDACKSAGYRHGCGFWIRKKSDQPFVFERKAYYLFDGLWTLKVKLDHHWGNSIENMKLRIVNFCSHGTALVKPPKFEQYHD